MRPGGGASHPPGCQVPGWAPVPGRAYGAAMRVESSVLSVSWIPSEAVKGVNKLPFEMGVAHYDEPPPDVVEDLAVLRDNDRFRFANELTAWAEFDGDRVVASGMGGGGSIGSTTLALGPKAMKFEAVALPDITAEPEVAVGLVRFRRTAGGRTGVPTPRHVNRPPFVKIEPPLAWTTLSLTLRSDGTATGELVGASPFPRHWVYGPDRTLQAKSGLIDFKTWFRDAFGKHTPWGDTDSPALVTEVETALERTLSSTIMRAGVKPKIRKAKAGTVLVAQGDVGAELFLLLDGVLRVDVDGTPLAELGPGALLGERAVLEGGRRTASLVAVTSCKVAVASAEDVDREELRKLSEGHRREERREGVSGEPQPERTEA